jgi:hypothetical protein
MTVVLTNSNAKPGQLPRTLVASSQNSIFINCILSPGTITLPDSYSLSLSPLAAKRERLLVMAPGGRAHRENRHRYEKYAVPTLLQLPNTFFFFLVLGLVHASTLTTKLYPNLPT